MDVIQDLRSKAISDIRYKHRIAANAEIEAVDKILAGLEQMMQALQREERERIDEIVKQGLVSLLTFDEIAKAIDSYLKEESEVLIKETHKAIIEKVTSARA